MLLKISAMLDSYIERKKGNCLVIPSPFDVILSEKPLTIVQPDIMIVCDKNKLDENRCNGAPDLLLKSFHLATHLMTISKKHTTIRIMG